MKTVFTFTFTAFFLALYAVLGGLVLSVLWGWFIVPVFSLPALTVCQSIGVSSVAGWLTYRPRSKEEEEKIKKEAGLHPFRTLTRPIVQASLVLAIGWIVHLFC